MEYLVLVAALLCLAAMLKLHYGRQPASAGAIPDEEDDLYGSPITSTSVGDSTT